jgi:hypothetical protein
MSIKPPRASQNTRKDVDTITFTFVDGQVDVKQPNKWLVPAPCAKKMMSLYNAMFKYMIGLGKHDAPLPDFETTCLTPSGHYNLGAESCVRKMKDLLLIDEHHLLAQKRAAMTRKRALEFSPRKANKRRPPTSTPTSTPKKLPIPSNNLE